MSTRKKTKSAKGRTAYLGMWNKVADDTRPERTAVMKRLQGKQIGMTAKGASSCYGSMKDMTKEQLAA